MPKLVAPGDKPVVLKAIHANAGVEAAYRKKLQAMVEEMSNSFVYWTRATLRKTTPLAGMAQDASPIVGLRKVMERLGRKWQKRFDDMSRDLAEQFADKSLQHTNTAMMGALKEAGFTVKFQFTQPLREALGAVIEENVGLIKSIPAEYLGKVQAEVWRSVKSGYDLETLTTTLQEKYGAESFKRAAFIARDQTNKAKAVIESKRRQELGITEAIWQHSGAGKHPRPEHLKAGKDKLRFDIKKGAYLDGKWIMPGEEPNCRCTSRAVIPGFK